MASLITRFDIEKFDGKNDFGLWKIKMCALMVQQGCDAALETLPMNMEAGEKDSLLKKAYSTLILCLRYHVLRDVTKETTATGILMKLTNLYMTKRESLTIEDVLATLNSRVLKKIFKGTKEETRDGLYVRGRSDHSEGHLNRDCLMKKSSGFIKKGKHDQDSDSFDDEGNTNSREALVVVGIDEMTELVMDLGGSYHMTHMRDSLYHFKVVNGGSVQLGDNKTCTIKGTKKVKVQLHDGSSFILKDVRVIVGNLELLQVYTADRLSTAIED
ncbi:hypothetical protein Tco_1474814 [Tanacetum coccineum]